MSARPLTRRRGERALDFSGSSCPAHPGWAARDQGGVSGVEGTCLLLGTGQARRGSGPRCKAGGGGDRGDHKSYGRSALFLLPVTLLLIILLCCTWEHADNSHGHTSVLADTQSITADPVLLCLTGWDSRLNSNHSDYDLSM